MAQSTFTSPPQSPRSRRTVIIAAVAVAVMAIAFATAAIVLILDDESEGTGTFTSTEIIDESDSTPRPRRGSTFNDVIAAAFAHLHSIDQFKIIGEFDA
jgi:hypothetical protein